MGKTVEYAMFEHLLSHARAAGHETIEGRFRPTDKNAAIADLLPELGFTPVEADGDVQRFEFPAGADPTGQDPQVTVIDEIPEGSSR